MRLATTSTRAKARRFLGVRISTSHKANETVAEMVPTATVTVLSETP